MGNIKSITNHIMKEIEMNHFSEVNRKLDDLIKYLYEKSEEDAKKHYELLKAINKNNE